MSEAVVVIAQFHSLTAIPMQKLRPEDTTHEIPYALRVFDGLEINTVVFHVKKLVTAEQARAAFTEELGLKLVEGLPNDVLVLPMKPEDLNNSDVQRAYDMVEKRGTVDEIGDVGWRNGTLSRLVLHIKEVTGELWKSENYTNLGVDVETRPDPTFETSAKIIHTRQSDLMGRLDNFFDDKLATSDDMFMNHGRLYAQQSEAIERLERVCEKQNQTIALLTEQSREHKEMVLAVIRSGLQDRDVANNVLSTCTTIKNILGTRAADLMSVDTASASHESSQAPEDSAAGRGGRRVRKKRVRAT